MLRQIICLSFCVSLFIGVDSAVADYDASLKEPSVVQVLMPGLDAHLVQRFDEWSVSYTYSVMESDAVKYTMVHGVVDANTGQELFTFSFVKGLYEAPVLFLNNGNGIEQIHLGDAPNASHDDADLQIQTMHVEYPKDASAAAHLASDQAPIRFELEPTVHFNGVGFTRCLTTVAVDPHTGCVVILHECYSTANFTITECYVLVLCPDGSQTEIFCCPEDEPLPPLPGNGCVNTDDLI